MANGSYADQCVGDDNIIPPSDAGELAFINGSFTTLGTTDDFFLADKSDGGATNGFLLTVTEDPSPDAPDNYLFLYTLAVPDEYVGLTADWVLAVKQASDSYIAYLFNDLTLGIEGGFNSFTLNGNGRVVNDYSHVTGFLRITGEDPPPPERVPEPGMLFLMGAGLAGLGLARRRKSA